MNYDQELKIIDEFVGRECERTLACSTLKIRFGKKNPYIWIDPPWVLKKNQIKITASIDYSTDEVGFFKWSETLAPLNSTIFEGYKYNLRDGLVLNFSHGITLHVPTTLDTIDEDDFYNHWYASK